MYNVTKAYYCKDEYGYLVTFDENEAKLLDKNYRLASINEVEEFIGLGLEPAKVIEVNEGIYGWMELEYEDSLGDIEYFCGYVRIGESVENKLKDLHRLIERMV